MGKMPKLQYYIIKIIIYANNKTFKRKKKTWRRHIQMKIDSEIFSLYFVIFSKPLTVNSYWFSQPRSIFISAQFIHKAMTILFMGFCYLLSSHLQPELHGCLYLWRSVHWTGDENLDTAAQGPRPGGQSGRPCHGRDHLVTAVWNPGGMASKLLWKPMAWAEEHCSRSGVWSPLPAQVLWTDWPLRADGQPLEITLFGCNLGKWGCV